MNPFDILFGKEPREFIQRNDTTNLIIRSFNEEPSFVYLVTGVRGSGKTVLISHMSKTFVEQKDWIVIDLNPETDILTSLVSKLYAKAGVAHLFLKKSFSINLKGISLSLSSGELLTDEESILEIMFKDIKKRNKKVLITIDEVSNSKEMKIFAHTFQSLVRQDFPAFLLMTGLFENVQSLQNEDTLTFLYRAPKVVLDKLNDVSIYSSYLRIFNNSDLAKAMTKCVNGYAYAYQLLGKIVYESNSQTLSDEILSQFDKEIAEYSYCKIWQECSDTDRKMIKAICSTDGSVSAIMDALAVNKSTFSVYRDRLIRKGFTNSSSRGYLFIDLPRFDKFIDLYSDFSI